MESREYLGYSYNQILQVVKFLNLVVPNFKPLVGVICGSGLGPLADSLSDKVEVPYEDIPLFPTSTVVGHGGKLVFGKVDDVPVVCMKGRFHAYEGYPLWKVVMPVRVMRLMGAQYLIVTNAAGGIPPEFNVGDMMIIKDHVNMMGMGGQNPLRGPNIEEFGPRFPAMNKTYDRGLVKAGLRIAEKLGMKDMTHEGVYACVGGPNYETIAELKMFQLPMIVVAEEIPKSTENKKTCGIDSVGMSTAHEAIAAAHCGMKVFAFSQISSKAILDYDALDEPDHEELITAVKASEEKLKTFTENMIKYIGGQSALDCGASGEGAAPPKAQQATQAVALMHFIPGICPAAIIQPCPCVSNAQLASPQAPCTEETPAEEAPEDDADGATEKAPIKRVSIQEPGEAEEEAKKEAAEAETTDEVGEVGEAPEAPTEAPAEITDEKPKEPAEAIKEEPKETSEATEEEPKKPAEAAEEETSEATEEEPKKPTEAAEEDTLEAEPIREASQIPAVTEEPTEATVDQEPKEPAEAIEEEPKDTSEATEQDPLEAEPISEASQIPEATVDEAGEAPEESEADKAVAVGPDASEGPENQDQQSQTVEDRGEQTESLVEDVVEELIKEVGLQIEESNTEDGVAIQTLPETAEAKVGVEEAIDTEDVAVKATGPIEASTETTAEAASEAPKATGEELVADAEKAIEEPKEAMEEPVAEPSSATEETEPPDKAKFAEEMVELPSKVAEPAGEEVGPRPAVECSAAVMVQCKSFAMCILREANVGPDTAIEPAVSLVEEKKETPVEQEPVDKQESCIAPCKKFFVRKKGDRCPTSCPPSKK